MYESMSQNAHNQEVQVKVHYNSSLSENLPPEQVGCLVLTMMKSNTTQKIISARTVARRHFSLAGFFLGTTMVLAPLPVTCTTVLTAFEPINDSSGALFDFK